MATKLQLIRHQFRKETREHAWFIFGLGCVVVLFAYLGGSSILERATDQWGRPLLMDHEELYLFISLLPPLLFAPFLAFGDPTNDPEAFWLTRPAGAGIVVGGKILFALVWLIGMPMIGECVTAWLLGAGAKVIYVAIDYFHIRAAFVLGALALGCLTNHPLRLILTAFAIPLAIEFFGALIQMATDNPLADGLPAAAAGALARVSTGVVTVGAILIAWAQYRWRSLRIGVPVALLCLVTTLVIDRQKVDLTRAPEIAADSAFAAVNLDLRSIAVEPGKLDVHGMGISYLTADAVLRNVPWSGTLGLVSWDLTIRANGGEHQLSDISGRWDRFDDEHKDRERVFQSILADFQGDVGKATDTLRAKIRIPLPTGLEREIAGNEFSLSGHARFDCFTYDEFARLEPAAYDGPTSPPSNRTVQSFVQRGGTRLTLIWPVAPANNRLIAMQVRRIAALLDPDNVEFWTDSHSQVFPWYFLLRDSRSGAVWNRYAEQHLEHNQAGPLSSIHLNRGWISVPSSFPANEVVAFRARHLGQRRIPFIAKSTKP